MSRLPQYLSGNLPRYAGGGRDPSYAGKTWVTMTARHIREAPFIADGRWNNAWPDNTDPVPPSAATEEQMYNISNWSRILCHVMRRHKDGVNVCFGDASTRHVRAEELWTLRWNQQSRPREVGDELGWMKGW